jgi:hypothetical protein
MWVQQNLERAKAPMIAPEIVKAGFIFGGSGGTIVHREERERGGGRCCLKWQMRCVRHLFGAAGCGGDHDNILWPRRAPSPTSNAADPRFHIRIMIVASNS